MERLGLGYEDVAAVHPGVIYVSVSGFGHEGSPCAGWPAYAPIVEAMSGVYEWGRREGEPPRPNPVGAGRHQLGPVLGDRRARRPPPPGPHGSGSARRRCDARRARVHDRRRHQPVVARAPPRPAHGADPRRLRGGRRVRRAASRAGAPVRAAGGAHRAPRVEQRRSLRHPGGLGRAPRDRRSPRARGLAWLPARARARSRS